MSYLDFPIEIINPVQFSSEYLANRDIRYLIAKCFKIIFKKKITYVF